MFERPGRLEVLRSDREGSQAERAAYAHGKMKGMSRKHRTVKCGSSVGHEEIHEELAGEMDWPRWERVRNARPMSSVPFYGQWEATVDFVLSRAMTMAPSGDLYKQLTVGQKTRWEKVRRLLCVQVQANASPNFSVGQPPIPFQGPPDPLIYHPTTGLTDEVLTYLSLPFLNLLCCHLLPLIKILGFLTSAFNSEPYTSDLHPSSSSIWTLVFS